MLPDLRFCLVVVFNHRFDRNLPLLRALYRGRFSHVRFLVPFYRGDDPDVIAVHASSATFQAYFAQAQPRLVGDQFSHYVFVADDLLLNPAVNEQNLGAHLRLRPGVGYLKEMRPFSTMTTAWTHFDRTLRALRFDEYVNARAELPAREEALARLARHGIHLRPLGWRNLEAAPGPFGQRVRGWLAAAWRLYGPGGEASRAMAYPLVMGYADLLVVPAGAMAEFCHLCGVFAAMNLFVECAAPTALALAAPELRREPDLATRGREIWSDADRAEFHGRHAGRLADLLTNFPADTLYVHPVKFSHWDTA